VLQDFTSRVTEDLRRPELDPFSQTSWRIAKGKRFACRSALGLRLRFWRRMRGGLGFCEGD
jgi:hypothetical protein